MSNIASFSKMCSDLPSSQDSGSTLDSQNSKGRVSGRPFTEVWKHVVQGKPRSQGHYEAKCKYCNKKWSRGKPINMRAHLATHCQNCPDDVSSYFAKIVANQENSEDDMSSDLEQPVSKRTKTTRKQQKGLHQYYSPVYLEDGRKKEIDRAILKAFVCCGISFAVIENPFFIEMLKTLQPGYTSPSCKLLAGNLLETEVAKVNRKIERELSAGENFTLGK